MFLKYSFENDNKLRIFENGTHIHEQLLCGDKYNRRNNTIGYYLHHSQQTSSQAQVDDNILLFNEIENNSPTDVLIKLHDRLEEYFTQCSTEQDQYKRNNLIIKLNGYYTLFNRIKTTHNIIKRLKLQSAFYGKSARLNYERKTYKMKLLNNK